MCDNDKALGIAMRDSEGIPAGFWQNPGEPFEAPDFPFHILDFDVALNIPEDLGRMVSRHLAFQPETGEPLPAHHVRVFRSPKPRFKIIRQRPYEYTIDFIHTPEHLDFFAYHFAARIPLGGGDPILALSDCPLKEMQGEVENFLWVYTSILLLKEDAVLLHSSAVVVGEETIVFFGHSGTGKSTSALLFQDSGYPVLSEDLNILFRRSGTWYVQASPFISEVKEVQPGTFPIRRIFFLFHAAENAIQEVGRPQQMAYLYSNLVVVNGIPGLYDGITQLIGTLLPQVRVSVLRFKNDKEFVPWLKSHC